MLFTAVFLISFSALCFEVLLARVFSISQWNHLSFMIISIAMFGFAAAGIYLSLMNIKQTIRKIDLTSPASIKIIMILYAFSEIAAFIILNRLPFDYFRMPIEPAQAVYLGLIYLFLSVPFFFAGLVISASYSSRPHQSGLIYFANMAGSACGAIFPFVFLPILGEEKSIVLTALAPLLMIPFKTNRFSLSKNYPRTYKRIVLSALTVALIATWLLFFQDGRLIKISMSSYKNLSQVLQYPETLVISATTDMKGRIEVVKSPYFRFAPGLSIKYTESLHSGQALFVDGDSPTYLYNSSAENALQFAGFTLPFAGYLLKPAPDHVLLIQQGGGSGIPCALISDAREITIIQNNAHIADHLRDQYNLSVNRENPRSFLARTRNRFDIIQVENWGNSIPGSEAMSQHLMFTQNAIRACLDHLAPDGILIFARKLLLPPSDMLRLVAGSFEALRSLDIEYPEKHIAILRNWSAFTLIISSCPLSYSNINQLKEFARKNNFDPVYFAGINKEETNQFNVFDKPYHFMEISRLINAYHSGSEKKYFHNHLLDVAPQSDSRPFHSKFLKWKNLKKIHAATGNRIYSFFMSGETIVPVVFLEALIISTLLLFFPLAGITGRNEKLSLRASIYFLAIGAGYIFIELYFIKTYEILTGDPVISFCMVLTGILIFSGIGGYIAQRSDIKRTDMPLLLLGGMLLFCFFGLETILHKILLLSQPLKIFTAALLLLPVGIMMGIPFPVGMHYILKSAAGRAYAWAANGCVSILAAIASAHIALNISIPAIIISAAAAYAVALIVSMKLRPA